MTMYRGEQIVLLRESHRVNMDHRGSDQGTLAVSDARCDPIARVETPLQICDSLQLLKVGFCCEGTS